MKKSKAKQSMTVDKTKHDPHHHEVHKHKRELEEFLKTLKNFNA